ncbi:MAG: chorismate mutase [Alphaproteobacteria bacterium]|nr:chorismate mutase [Alphaproteobacteria bacterium]
MDDDGKSLGALRREIDEIDDDIHDLLMKRAAVAKRVGAAKGQTSVVFLRPAREASVLRRLAARHDGVFQVASVLHIWREIFAALTRLQGPYSVAVLQPEGAPDYRRLARAHFGAFTPITPLARAGHVVAAVRDGSASVGVLPMPDEDDPEPWWRYLISDNPDRTRIVSRLPSIETAEAHRDDLAALVIARVDFEDSGDDHSFLVFQSEEHISRGRLRTALAEGGFSQFLYAAWRDPEHPVSWQHLVELGGHFAADDATVQRLVGGFAPKIDKVHALGGYPVPVNLTAEPGAPGGGP